MKTHWDLDSFSLDIADLLQFPGHSGGAGPAKWSAENESLILMAQDKMKARFRSGEVGFYDHPNAISGDELESMQRLARRLRNEYEGAVIFGIGGSYLGGETIFEALRDLDEARKFPIAWVSNVDPSAIRRAEHFLKDRRVASIIISKSGGTTETLGAFFHFSRKLDPKGIVVITDPQSGELRRLARSQGWPHLPVPQNVGGRYSVLTSVGLFPSYLGGVMAEEILEGARRMRACLEASAPLENPAYSLALVQHDWDRRHGHPIQYFMPYARNLRSFADWYVQLWAESLGKKKRSAPRESVGFTPVAALGTSDQHSLLQLFKEGPSDKIVGFVDVRDEGEPTTIGEPAFAAGDYRFLFTHSFQEITHQAGRATRQSLKNSGVPTYRLEIKKLDAQALGALFFFFETACAFAGEIYDVNAFDQPGVEESKKLLRAAL